MQDGVNGFLVPVANAKSLETSMLKVIKQRNLITAMGLESRRIALEKYDLKQVNLSMLDAIELD